jgi:DNA-binding NtrC family response regulator
MSSFSTLENLEGSLEGFREEITDAAHVALIEPDEVLRKQISSALEKRGVTVFAFDYAPFFWEWQATESLALLIVNFDNREAAFDTLSRLRKLEPLCEFIALATEPDAAVTVQCLSVGAQDLLALPLHSIDLLGSRVNAGLERWRRAVVDQRITDQFHAFAASLLRKDTQHMGAVHRFEKQLQAYKRSLAEHPELIYVVANTYAAAGTAQFLESEDYRVHIFDSVKEAVAASQDIEARVLLAEAELSDGTAFDAYKQISSIHPDIEFLVVSTANAADVALLAMENGARDCILKPHEGLEAIQQKTRRALSLQTAHWKHHQLVDQLRRLCAELVDIDNKEVASGDPIMIKMDPGRSQATLNRMLADLNREEQKRLRKIA